MPWRRRCALWLRPLGAGDAPFGCVLSFYGPHLPVAPPPPWDSMYDLADVPLPPTVDVGLEGKPLRQRTTTRIRASWHWSSNELRDYVRRYYGYVSYIDAQMQRVLEALERLGVAEDTIILFTTDHGDMLGHFGMVYKLTGNAYDTLMQVPLMIRWPKGIPAGQVDDGLVSNVDLLPTLLELARVPVPSGVDGQSLAATVQGKVQPRREAIITDIMGTGFMLRRGQWKYALHASASDTETPRDLDELYNLDDDPYETHNLADDPAQAERVASMREEILTWLRETGHPYAELVAQRAAMEAPRAEGLYPELLAFQDMGGGRFWLRYRWVRTSDLPDLTGAEDHATLTRRGPYGRITTLWETTGPSLPQAEGWELGPAEERVVEGRVAPDVPSGMAELNLGLRIPGRSVLLASGYKDVMPWARLDITRRDGGIRLKARVMRYVVGQ